MLSRTTRKSVSTGQRVLKKAFAGFNNPYRESDYLYSSSLKFLEELPKLETYRELELSGKPINPESSLTVEKDKLLKVYETMVRTDITDEIMLKAQRQGRITFYMSSWGETATIIGATAGLKDHDVLMTQYREHGAFIYRGYTIDQMIAQCTGNINDVTSGRQMPIHYTASNLNIQCVSSPLATQIPHCSGAGYAFKLENEDRISATFFGEGTTSEGDFHSALNFAATLGCQSLFICRNIKYAISTSDKEQFVTDGVAGRGLSYGMKTIRVDGNDAVAVVQATEFARDYIVTEQKPVFMECMTYRQGDHSTSDYSALYRDLDEVESWKSQNDPVQRLEGFLRHMGWLELDQEQIAEIRAETLAEITKSLKEQSSQKLPKMDLLFEDVYDSVPANLLRQKREMEEAYAAYPELIDTSRYADE